MREGAPVVAGIDGSPDSRAAAEFAAAEAERRGLWLRLVHSDERHDGERHDGERDGDGQQGAGRYGAGRRPVLPSDVIEGTGPADAGEEGGSGDAEANLDRLAADLRGRHHGLRVECVMRSGDASGVLVDESNSASLLVLGSRGLGRLSSLLSGSVSEQVATHAHAPVIVMPGRVESRPAVRSGPVLVGVDGSDSSAEAIGFACDEAASRGEPLLALRVFEVPRRTREQAEEALEAALADRLGGSPPVRVRRLVVEASNPTEALLRVGRQEEASLVTVGSRGRGGFAGLLLGSVGRALLSHADRPVAIVHPRA
ncbi:universal stress protein [Rugosimonospora acidiphila]|uniref:Universal stress protein n=1 Tax=Rugosimonospora acidiphila TaxID=556531 RepID=A0ABP9RUP7_9ACTN